MERSRLGKTALWSGTCNERVAMVASKNPGCGWAALSLWLCSANIAFIITSFRHWIEQYLDFADRNLGN